MATNLENSRRQEAPSVERHRPAESTSMDRSQLINLPNILTISRICLTVLFLGMLFADNWYGRSVAFVVFCAASLTDLYDGRLARSRAQVTRFGTFMDPLADKILVTSALVALVVSPLEGACSRSAGCANTVARGTILDSAEFSSA